MTYRTISASGLCCALALTIAVAFASAQNPTPRTPNPAPGETPNQQPGNRPETTPSPSTTTPGQQNNRPVRTVSGDDSFLNQAIEASAAEVQLGRLAASKGQNQRVKDFANMMVKDHSQGLEKLQRAQQGTSQGGASTASGTSTRESSRGQSGTSTAQGGTSTGQAGTTTERSGTATRETSRGQSGTTAGQAGTTTGPRSADDVQLSSKHEMLKTRLSGLSGAQFDREYMEAMVAGHREMIGLLEKQAGDTSSNRGTSGREPTQEKAAAPDLNKLAQEMLPTTKQHLAQAEQIEKSLSAPAK